MCPFACTVAERSLESALGFSCQDLHIDVCSVFFFYVSIQRPRGSWCFWCFCSIEKAQVSVNKVSLCYFICFICEGLSMMFICFIWLISMQNPSPTHSLTQSEAVCLGGTQCDVLKASCPMNSLACSSLNTLYLNLPKKHTERLSVIYTLQKTGCTVHWKKG